jgi:hypothetical protein
VDHFSKMNVLTSHLHLPVGNVFMALIITIIAVIWPNIWPGIGFYDSLYELKCIAFYQSELSRQILPSLNTIIPINAPALYGSLTMTLSGYTLLVFDFFGHSCHSRACLDHHGKIVQKLGLQGS